MEKIILLIFAANILISLLAKNWKKKQKAAQEKASQDARKQAESQKQGTLIQESYQPAQNQAPTPKKGTLLDQLAKELGIDFEQKEAPIEVQEFEDREPEVEGTAEPVVQEFVEKDHFDFGQEQNFEHVGARTTAPPMTGGKRKTRTSDYFRFIISPESLRKTFVAKTVLDPPVAYGRLNYPAPGKFPTS